MEKIRLEHGRMKKDKIRLDKVIGANIKRERIARKMSRDELTKILELTVSHLGLIERGERGATSVILEKLSNIFDTPIDHFFTEHTLPFQNRTSKREKNTGPYRLKVNTLIASLKESELEALTHTITAVLRLRNID